MSEMLEHRGPDSGGEHHDGPVALAARRLSIVDLAHGDQPIANEDGSCVVVQNGEIYNSPRAARRARARRAPFPDALRHRGDRPPLRGARRRLRRAAARHVRDRGLGRVAPPARARARPLRDQAALLPALGGRAALRVGGALAAARRGRSRRARGVPRLQLDPGALFDLPGCPQAAGRPRARLGGERHGDDRALRASGAVPGGRAARGRRSRARRGAAGTAPRLGPRPPACRRPGRRPPLRRRRLGGARGACRAGDGRAGAHVHDRLRGAELRRAGGRATRRRALRHEPPRAARPSRPRAAPAGARRGVRRAVRRLVRAADLPRLAARRRAREGGPLRRGRRRALRRLLHVCGRPARRPVRAGRPARAPVRRGAARVEQEGEPRLPREALRAGRAPASARAPPRLEGDLLGRRAR